MELKREDKQVRVTVIVSYGAIVHSGHQYREGATVLSFVVIHFNNKQYFGKNALIATIRLRSVNL